MLLPNIQRVLINTLSKAQLPFIFMPKGNLIIFNQIWHFIFLCEFNSILSTFLLVGYFSSSRVLQRIRRHQCDKIWLFLTTKFLSKVAQLFGDFSAFMFVPFRQLFEEWATFYSNIRSHFLKQCLTKSDRVFLPRQSWPPPVALS